MMAARARVVWRCQECGASAPRWMGRCSECGVYGSLVEEAESVVVSASSTAVTDPVSLADVGSVDIPRIRVGIPEVDRVLGGGLVKGSLVLLGGEPGIGKSTLLLQVADKLSQTGSRVLYVCGEESPEQVGLRARRLGALGEQVSLFAHTDIAVIEQMVSKQKPDVIVLDSIQTVYDAELTGAPGSVGQVRACTGRIMRIAKGLGVTTFIVGHVTKDGSIAGPRVLEHMVDTVLYFEGDTHHLLRIVRAVKNRFGSSSEIGVFEMTESGLSGVDQPSSVLLSDRGDGVAGSAVMIALEGSRPIAVEIQALVSPSYLPSPRRLATGIDTSRLLQVIAVLERRAGVSFASQDVHVAVGGGLRVSEPAADLPLALALASSVRDRAVPAGLAAFGELALTGAVRPVPGQDIRAREAERLGFTDVLISSAGEYTAQGVGTHAVADIERALSAFDSA